MKPDEYDDDDIDLYTALKAAGQPVALKIGEAHEKRYRWCMWDDEVQSMLRMFDEFPCTLWGKDNKIIGKANDLAEAVALVNKTYPVSP